MPLFTYSRPTTIEEALSLLKKLDGQNILFAGGTDIIPMMRSGQLSPKHVVDVKAISDLQGIVHGENGETRIGSAVLVHELEDNQHLIRLYPALIEAALTLGSYPVRCRATIGGNVCRASPSADLIPPLLIYETQARIVGPDRSRLVPLDDFFTGPGQTILERGEILVELILPPPNDEYEWRSTYIKHGPRKAMDLAVAGVAVALGQNSAQKPELRIALGAVSPTPIRAISAEIAWKEQGPMPWSKVGELAAMDCKPISDIRGSAEYRKRLVNVLVARALENLNSSFMEANVG